MQRTGRTRPHHKNNEMLAAIVKKAAEKMHDPKGNGKYLCPTRTQKISSDGNKNIANNEMQGGEGNIRVLGWSLLFQRQRPTRFHNQKVIGMSRQQLLSRW